MNKKVPGEKVKLFIYVRYFYYHKILPNIILIYSLAQTNGWDVDKVNLDKGNYATYNFEHIHLLLQPS